MLVLVDQVVRANPANDNPVLVQRQNLGNIPIPYNYFIQQTPQTQVQPPQQQLPPPQQQQVPQPPPPPQPLVEQREPLVDQRQQLFDQRQQLFDQRQQLFDQRQQLFDQRQQLPNQRQPQLNKIQPVVNIRPLVMGHIEPDVEPKQFLDPKPQFFDQRQPELNRRQPVFNINPLVIGQREPNVELKPTDVEQRGSDFIQRQPLNNQQNFFFEQRLPSFSIAEQNPSTVNQGPALGQNQPLVIEQREPNVEPKQPEVVQREPNLDQKLQLDNQRQLFFQQILPFLNPQQELVNVQTLGQTAVQAQPVADQGMQFYVERTDNPFIGQVQPSTEPKQVVFEFVTQSQPYLLSAHNVPTYKDQTMAADQSTDSSGVEKKSDIGWSIETMAPELRNDNWWKSDKMLEERARLARRAPF